MARGGATVTKVHYKGKADDFLVFIDDHEALKKYLSEPEGQKITPLSQVVSSFQVFSTNQHGAQGEYNTPSDGSLENEFNTKTVEDVIKVILAKGTVQDSELQEHQGRRNDSRGTY